MNALRLLGALLCLTALPATAFAQRETATAIGTIADAQNAVLPGVTITARNTETGISRAGVSEAEGRYRIPVIPPGVYDFSAELSGFQTSVRKGVTLTVGAEAVINFQLAVAGVSEALTVTAQAPVVQTTTAAIEGTIGREQIDLLPLIGRSYESLLRLMPGTQDNNGTTGFGGARGRSNRWYIDGVDNTEDISGYSRQTPALDSIKEVEVLVTGFKAEYTAAGGVVNAITRSGTNQLHGNGLVLFRNQDMMAKSPYATSKDPFRRTHVGGTVGGPIEKDKIHFFGTYERQDRKTFSTNTYTLPPATANFSTATRQFLSSNGIDPAIFGEGGNQRLSRPEFVYNDQATVRVDQQLTPARFLTFRYTMENDYEPSGSNGGLLDVNGNSALFRTNYATVNYKWIASANKLNEVYFQFGQTYGDWFAMYPNLVNVTVTGGPSIGGASNYPQGRTDYVYQAVDNFTWTRPGTRTGDHDVKMGAQLKFFRSDSFFDSNYRGTYSFPSLQAFVNGTPSRFTQNRGDSRLARPDSIYGFYIQDDWRPQSSLVLNLGIRYDYAAAKTEALKDVTGTAGPGISGDKNNFAPRFGFSWAPHASTKQVVYGGTGMYTDQIILNIIGNARFTPPKVIGVQIDNPPFPTLTSGSVTIPPANLSVIDPSLNTGYSWNSQIGYRRELMPNLGLDVSFVYNRGYDQVAILNANAYRPGTASLTGTVPAGVSRPDPTAGNVSFYSNYGIIRYTGLLVDLKKRFSNRFSGGVAYTLSKTDDNGFNFVSDFQVPTNMALNNGPGNTDQRHRIEMHGEATLPWDLQFAGIIDYRSEQPLNITAGGRDLNGDGITGDWVNEAICLNITCPDFAYSRNSVTELSTADANALRALLGQSAIDVYNNNPKYFNMDVTLQKKVRFGRQGARITVEAFNVFNIPQRNQPNQNILSNLFGQYTSVSQPRAIQLTLQYDF